MSFECDFYETRELNLVLDYFRRKSEGDFSIPVPSLTVFEHVISSDHATLSLATFAERELRAIYLGIGRPVSQAQAGELIHCWHSGEASGLAGEIKELEAEIESIEAQLDCARDELEDLKFKQRQVGKPDDAVPEDLLPVIEALQREGA